MKSEKGFGILQVILTLGIIVLMALAVVQSAQLMNEQSLSTKALVGKETLVNGLLSLVSVESMCERQLNIPSPLYPNPNNATPIAFSTSKATAPAGSAYSARQNLSFNLSTSLTTTPKNPITIGWVNPAGSPAPQYYPQFNSFVGSIYFLIPTPPAVPVSYKEKAIGDSTLINAQVYQGQLWVNTGRPADLANPTIDSVNMADVEIASNLYVWVSPAGNVVGCGILKSPEQVCVDDMAGTFNPGAVPPAIACSGVQTPCPSGDFFLGFSAAVPPVANCVPSPATCPVAGETVVYQGGVWTCAPMPL